MIDIDFSSKTSLVRSNIGDPKSQYVSDGTILSALSNKNNDVNKASILVMETMLSWFSTLADESKTDQVEYKYRGLYERYKSLLQDFESKVSSGSGNIPIIIGGVSLEERNRVISDPDSFRPFDLPDWDRLVHEGRLIRDN